MLFLIERKGKVAFRNWSLRGRHLPPVALRLIPRPPPAPPAPSLCVELSKAAFPHPTDPAADSIQKAGLPAIIYSFQNLLIMQGFLYLDGLTINLINQTKTIFTAVCVYLLLGRRQSTMQCVALAMLFGASVLLALDKAPENKADALPDVDYNTWLFGGVLPVFAASILSGVASALSQRSLQVGYPRVALAPGGALGQR